MFSAGKGAEGVLVWRYRTLLIWLCMVLRVSRSAEQCSI